MAHASAFSSYAFLVTVVLALAAFVSMVAARVVVASPVVASPVGASVAATSVVAASVADHLPWRDWTVQMLFQHRNLKKERKKLFEIMKIKQIIHFMRMTIILLSNSPDSIPFDRFSSSAIRRFSMFVIR